MAKPKADVWIVRAKLQCGGCEDVSEIKRETTWAHFEEAVAAFEARHASCPKQGKLPEGVE